MTSVRTLAALGVLTMGGALLWGFTMGDVRGEGAILMSLTWGVISVIDVYTGAALFSGWIVFRERSAARALPWIAGIVLLGNFVTSLYALLAAIRSGGDWQRFWFGRSYPRGSTTMNVEP